MMLKPVFSHFTIGKGILPFLQEFPRSGYLNCSLLLTTDNSDNKFTKSGTKRMQNQKIYIKQSNVLLLYLKHLWKVIYEIQVADMFLLNNESIKMPNAVVAVLCYQDTMPSLVAALRLQLSLEGAVHCELTTWVTLRGH